MLLGMHFVPGTILNVARRRILLYGPGRVSRLAVCSRHEIHCNALWRRGLSTPGGKTTSGKGEEKKQSHPNEAQQLDRRKVDQSSSIVEQIFAEEERKPTTVVEKVKETTKDVTYFGVVLAGVTVAGALFYMLFREIWSSKSPGGVYKNAFKMVKAHPELVETLGEPVKAYGETTRRGRRRHPAHLEFEQDGVNCMRMKFYVEGALRKGTVHLEVREDEFKKYQYRYLYVTIEGHPQKTIVLVDNR